MTLTAIDAQVDHAVLITDGLVCSFNNRRVSFDGRKGLVLPSINAAVASQGTVDAGQAWEQAAPIVAAETGDFDRFVDYVSEWMDGTEPKGPHTSVLYAVGWSPSRGRFTAYAWAYAGSDVCRRWDLTDELHIFPTPLDLPPSPLELARAADINREYEQAGWSMRVTYPPAEPIRGPLSARAWAEVVRRVRRTRSLVDKRTGLHVAIGGTVTLTRLHRDQPAESTVIHQFDDTGAELVRMMQFTQHPTSQLGPCPCGSGELYTDCHQPGPDTDCTCESGRRFGDCCRIDAADAADHLAAAFSG